MHGGASLAEDEDEDEEEDDYDVESNPMLLPLQGAAAADSGGGGGGGGGDDDESGLKSRASEVRRGVEVRRAVDRDSTTDGRCTTTTSTTANLLAIDAAPCGGIAGRRAGSSPRRPAAISSYRRSQPTSALYAARRSHAEIHGARISVSSARLHLAPSAAPSGPSPDARDARPACRAARDAQHPTSASVSRCDVHTCHTHTCHTHVSHTLGVRVGRRLRDDVPSPAAGRGRAR